MRPMSDTQHFKSSIVSIRSSDKIEADFRKMKINENGLEQSNPYPDRPGERDCQFYLRTGLCGYGSSCRYNHPTHLPQGIVYYKDELPERAGQPDCEYYLKTGACKYGSTCKYHHPKDRNGAEPVLFNLLGLPMRHGEKPCPYYLRTGTCRFGVACKFHHPQPDNGLSTAYGMSSFPSAGLPYASGGLTMMSTYGTLPRPQVPQSYVPIMVSPSQGVLPPQGWATYMAASNSLYNMKTQAYYSVPNASVPMAVALNRGLPESSKQPECRFFMNNGTCKYGDDCKYNHPGVRILPPAPPPPNLINPFVLPARPGQPTCGNFRSYGFCKFGPNCKFDHSILACPAMTMSSSLPTPYAIPVTHQKISPSPSRTDLKSLSNGKPDVKKENSETEKPDDDSGQLNNSDVKKDVQVLSQNSASP